MGGKLQSVHFLAVIHIIIAVCLALDIKINCPDEPLRNLRARAVCQNSSLSYVCLDNTHISSAHEECVEILQFAPVGQKLVWTGDRRNVDCTGGRFQPFALWENVSNDCLFFKSLCAEEGQLIFSKDRNTRKDWSCRCDHNKGYGFVVRPKHSIFCFPKEEDCTCFIKTCPVHKQLSYDYTCVLEEGNRTEPAFTKAPVITHNLTSLKHVNSSLEYDNTTSAKRNAAVLASVFFALILAVGLFAFLWDPSCPHEQSATDNPENVEAYAISSNISGLILPKQMKSDSNLNLLSWCASKDKQITECSDGIQSFDNTNAQMEPMKNKGACETDNAGNVESLPISNDISMSRVPSKQMNSDENQNLVTSISSDSKRDSECNDKDDFHALNNTQKCGLEPQVCTADCETDNPENVESSAISSNISRLILPPKQMKSESNQNLLSRCASKDKQITECNDKIQRFDNTNAQMGPMKKKGACETECNNKDNFHALNNTQKCGLEPLVCTADYETEYNDRLDNSCLNVNASVGKSMNIVVAIDIGTTFTRYAFLAIDDFCSGNYKAIIKNSMPTRVLFKKTGEFVSFGDGAEVDYCDALYWGYTDKFTLFENFKIEIYRQQDITTNTMIFNDKEESVLASNLFGAVVKSVKDEVMEKIRGADIIIEMEKIFWVLTVPDAWSKSAVELFRMCCEESGIPDANLLLEEESTAASMYFSKIQPDSPSRWFLGANCTKNMTYLLIDLGGGTCDITVYNRMNGTDTKHQCRPSYSVCGNKIVVKEFFDTIETIIGDRALIAMEKEERAIYLRWKKDLEELISSPKDTVKVPVQTIDTFCQQFKGKTFKEAVECFGLFQQLSAGNKSKLVKQLSLDGDNLYISNELKSSLFNRVIQSIISEIKSILKREKSLDIHTFFIMGGFAASTIVKDAIKTAFSDKSVIYSEDSKYSLTVGSLLCGFQQLGHDL